MVVSGLTRFRQGLTAVADDLLPPAVGIALPGEDAPWTPDTPADYCVRCGHDVGPGEMTLTGCSRCDGRRLPWHRVVRLGAYDGPVGERIRRMKFTGQWQWATQLGALLAERVPAPGADPGQVVVVPVPMHWLRRWWRGFNQASLLATAIAEHRGWLMLEALHRTRHTAPQTTLAPSSRAKNVSQSFAARAVDLKGLHVVLVDDVLTTGATARPCCRLLKQMGARTITMAVVAVARAD